nr:PREDICTED: uncharacterized protein LOC104946565 [Notothenia coriiceps]
MGSAEFSDRMWSYRYSLSPPTLKPSCFRLHDSSHLEKIGGAFWHLDNCLRLTPATQPGSLLRVDLTLQIQVMPLLRTLLSALLLVLSVSEPLNSPEENENEVFKHPEAEHTKSQNQVMENVIGNLSEPTPSNTLSTALESLTTTVPPSTSLPPQCPGNQVKLENSSVCSCPSGMVKEGDNCSCPGGFTLEGAAGCKVEERQNERLTEAAPLTTTVSPSTSLPPHCPGNQVKLENSSVCSCMDSCRRCCSPASPGSPDNEEEDWCSEKLW